MKVNLISYSWNIAVEVQFVFESSDVKLPLLRQSHFTKRNKDEKMAVHNILKVIV